MLMFYGFYQNYVNVIVDGVYYRTSGILKFDKFCNQTTTVSKILVQLVSVL